MTALKHFKMTALFNKGFTLIELLVVVLIIGVLAAVALPQYNRAVLRSRFVQAQTLAKNFADAAGRYYLANGAAPDYWTDLDISFPKGWSVDGGWMTSKNVACDLKNKEDNNVVCFINMDESYRLAYVQFFAPEPDKRECWARKDDADAQAVCKGLGGTEVGVGDHFICSKAGGCILYTLP